MAYAAHKGDLLTVKRLQIELSEGVARTKFAKAADAAIRTFLDFIDPRMIGTSAFSAAQENRHEIIRLLHELRADLDKPSTEGATPTIIAAQFGHTSMVQLLYDLGADVHRTSNDGFPPIHTAAMHGRDETVLLLLSMRAKINDADNVHGMPPLVCALRYDNSNTVRLLLSLRAERKVNCQGSTLRACCDIAGARKSLKALEEHGAL